MQRVLVTGAAGFVGRRVVADLRSDCVEVVATARSPGSGLHPVGTVTPETDWRALLSGCDGVIHLLARVHSHDGDRARQFAVNRDVTLRLARDAAASGVRRLVFVSTIKVNGERATPAAAFTPDDLPAPEGDYALSKLAAERGLRAIAADTGLEVVIVRPPLVYGAGVGANFRSLIDLVARGLPLPFASVDNRRSLIGVGNLSSLLRACLVHPEASGRVFLAADGAPVSLPALLKAIGDARGRPARLWPVPPAVLAGVFRLIGRPGLVDRLLGDLVVDPSLCRSALGWAPPFRLEEGLAEAVGSAD